MENRRVQNHPIEEPPVVVGREEAFLRNARQTARQALFFLYQLQLGPGQLDRRLESHRAFVWSSAQNLIDALHGPGEGRPRPEQPSRFEGLTWSWEKLRLLAHRPPGADEVRALVSALESFLAASGPPHDDVGEELARNLDLVGLLAARNWLGLAAIAIAAVIAWRIEALRALLFNQGWFALIALGLPAVFLLLIAIASRFAPPLRTGAYAFWARDARRPPPGIKLWDSTHALPAPLLPAFLLQLLALGLLLLGAGVAIHLLAQNKPSLLTSFIVSSLLALFTLVSHWIDRWAFVDHFPVRGAAIFFGGVALYLAVSGLPIGATLFTLAGAAFVCFVELRRLKRRALTLAAVGLVVVAGLISLVSSETLRGFAADKRAKGLDRALLGVDDDVWEDPPGVGQMAPRVAAENWPFPGTSPVVLIAASGGGSRAALYAAKALQKLEQGEFAAIGQNIHAISSVSGGSLASAAYIARRLNKKGISDLEQSVQKDFLLPTLLGALIPRASRAKYLERSWDDDAGGPSLAGTTISLLAQRWNEALAGNQPGPPPFPLPLFNTCSLDGHDVVVSPLAREHYADATADHITALRASYKELFAQDDRMTWVVDRDAIYGLEDLLPAFDPSLAKAVRASANFPFGFPLVKVLTHERALLTHPFRKVSDDYALVKLTDGGVLSNSGMWSLMPLIVKHEEALKKRGVLLIVVEASHMPEYSPGDDVAVLYGELGNRQPHSQRLHREMYSVLQEKFADRIAVIQLDIIPKSYRDSFNLYTSWALDRDAIDKLTQSFDYTWEHSRGCLLEQWSALTNNQPPPCKRALMRPPLD